LCGVCPFCRVLTKEQLTLEIEFTPEQGAAKRYIKNEAVTAATYYGSVVVNTNKLPSDEVTK